MEVFRYHQLQFQDQYTYFSDYPSFHINKDTIVEKTDGINNVNIGEFVEFKSINFIENIVPPIKDIISVDDYLSNNSPSSVLNIINKLKISDELAYKIVLWLTKYGYLRLRNDNEK